MATQTQSKQSEAKLLVVEDDANILELLSASLRFAGFDVSTATSGSAAVTAAKNATPEQRRAAIERIAPTPTPTPTPTATATPTATPSPRRSWVGASRRSICRAGRSSPWSS